MSSYTTQVRTICEQSAGLTERSGNIEETIQKAIPFIFPFSFPIYDESYRNVLETKILRHYYTREIGLETAALWKHFLNMKLNEIMPYYNELYRSAALEYNPLTDYNLTTKHTLERIGEDTGTHSDESNVSRETSSETNSSSNSKTDSTATSTTSENSTNYNLHSDTPQGSLINVENETYLSDATKNKDESNGTTTGSGSVMTDGTADSNTEGTEESTTESSGKTNRNYSSTDEYVQTIVGKSGGKSYSALIQEFRDTLLNIDMMIIEELSELFLNIY